MSRHATRALCQFAPWHFALFIQGRLIDRILAHFRWILVHTIRTYCLVSWSTTRPHTRRSGKDGHERISAATWTMTMNQVAKMLAFGPNSMVMEGFSMISGVAWY